MPELLVVSSVEDVHERLASEGAILFRDVGVSDARSFEEFSANHVVEWMEYQDRASKRSHVRGHIHTSTDTPAAFPIALHCESSFASRWPQKIFFFCHIAPSSGGRTPICDMQRVYRNIDPGIREKFERLGVMYYRNFSRGVGMDWRDVFQKVDRQSVDAYCASHGIHAEWLDDDRLRTIQVRPATLTHPRTGQTVWFNHALALHKSSLDDSLKETLLRQGGESNLPHNTYFGNGEPIPNEVIQHIRDVHARFTILFDWRPGDVLMLDNMLMAHGREPYEGERVVYAAMADPLTWREVGVELTVPAEEPMIADDHGIGSTKLAVKDVQPVDADLDRWFLEAVARELHLETVNGADCFAAIGGDSLTGVKLISDVFDRYGVDLSLETLIESETLDAVLDRIRFQHSG